MKQRKPKSGTVKNLIGWILLILAIYLSPMAYLCLAPALQIILNPVLRTGSAGTTVGMGLGIGMPFLMFSLFGFAIASYLLLSAKSKKYRVIFFIIVALLTVGYIAGTKWRLDEHTARVFRFYDKYSKAFNEEVITDEIKNEINKPIQDKDKINVMFQVFSEKSPSKAIKLYEDIINRPKIDDISYMALNWLTRLDIDKAYKYQESVFVPISEKALLETKKANWGDVERYANFHGQKATPVLVKSLNNQSSIRDGLVIANALVHYTSKPERNIDAINALREYKYKNFKKGKEWSFVRHMNIRMAEIYSINRSVEIDFQDFLAAEEARDLEFEKSGQLVH